MSDAFTDFQRADELLRRVLDLPPDERAEFLDRECGDDSALRASVDELLASMAATGLEPGGVWRSAVPDDDQLPQVAVPGDILGAYRILGEIGRGGMAVVYLAERADGAFEGQAALKLLHRSHGTEAMERRFVQERQILANLRHPHIAQLIDGGTTDSGRPFLAMEHVDGEPIDRWCDRRRASIEQRLKLFRKVCTVVHFAHRNLVVHRDLKPSNILITTGGEPKLLDFGIAKLLEPGPDGAGLTQTARIDQVLTPRYASPEQVLGEPVSTATDVYALGMLLFELLTGRGARRLTSTRPSELERAAGEAPPAPSSVVEAEPEEGDESAEQLAAARRLTPARLRSRLRGDLDTIVAMALRREPERRYSSVAEFADDVGRHLDGLPVIAHRDSLLYRTKKLLRRRAGAVAAAALVTLTLVAATVVTSVQARRAQQEARRAEEVVGLLMTLLEDADPDRSQGRDVTVREVLDQAAGRLEVELAQQPRVQAQLQDLVGRVYARLGLAEQAARQLEQALQRRRELLGADDPSTASTARHLALARLEQGRREEAEELARQSLEVRRGTLGRDDPAVAESLVTLGRIRYERGAVDVGRRLIEEALELLEDRGDAERRLADALHVAALVELEAGELARSEDLARRELEIRRRHGPRSRDLALALHTLSSPLQIQGDEKSLAEAVALLEEAIEIESALLGADHLWTLNLLADLAGTRARQGDFEGGERAFREALATAREALGADHPFVAMLHNNLAVFYHRQQRWPQAIEHYRQSLALRQRVLEAGHPLIGTTRAYLGLALHRAGDPAAEATYRQALEELIASRGAEHEKVGNLRTDLGLLLAEQERYEAAEPQLRQAFTIVRPIFGDADQRTDSARAGLGLALCGLGRQEEGIPLIEASSSWRQKRYSEDHWRLEEIERYRAVCAR